METGQKLAGWIEKAKATPFMQKVMAAYGAEKFQPAGNGAVVMMAGALPLTVPATVLGQWKHVVAL